MRDRLSAIEIAFAALGAFVILHTIITGEMPHLFGN